MRTPINGGSAHRWIRSNILGLVAIFIALSGSAMAAQVATDGGNATAAKKKKGKVGPRGPAGPPGPPGQPGQAGAPGSAVAFAHVLANGTLDTANSKNIAATEGSAQPGYYCVLPSVPYKNFVASVDSSGGGVGFFATASLQDDLTDCDAGAVDVSIWRHDSVLTSLPFYIVFN